MTKQKCLNKTTSLITAFFITLFAITTLQAQTLNVEGASPLEIYHFTGVKVEGKLKHNTLIFLSQEIGINETITPKFFVPRGIVVTSKIMDQNPLLFTYDSKLETYETADYKIFKKLLPKVDSVLTAMRNFVRSDPKVDNLIIALETTIGKIRKFVNDRGEIIDLTLDEFKVPIAKKRVLDWTLSEVKEQLADDYEKVETYWLENNINPSFKDLELIRSQSTLNDIVIELEKFTDLVGKVNTPLVLETIIDTTDTRKGKKLIVSIKTNQYYRKILSDKAVKAQQINIRNITVKFEKKSWAKLALAVGAIYSFVDNPEFSVKEDDNGNRTIIESSNDYNELSGAVMLNVIPNFAFQDQVEPFFQIGASAGSGDIGLLFGGGCSFFPFPKDNEMVRSLTISGGLIWQQVEELASGLSVGDSITKHSELKTEDKWDSGLYLMIGIAF